MQHLVWKCLNPVLFLIDIKGNVCGFSKKSDCIEDEVNFMTTENAIVMGLHYEFVTGGRYMDVDPNPDTKWNTDKI